MSSIVAWLAARSLPGTRTVAADNGAPMPQVRPRLPGRYETDAASPSAPPEEAAHEEAPAATPPAPRTEAAAPAREQRRGEPEHQPQQRPAAVPPIVAVEPPASEHSAPRAHAAHDVAPAVTKVAPPASKLPIDKTRDASAKLTNNSAQAGPAATAGPPEPAPHEAAPRHPAPPRDFAGEQPRATPTEPAEMAPREKPRPPPTPAVLIATAQRAPVVRAEPIVPSHADRPRAPVPDIAAAAPPPRVQVTIERLEIRAATAQPPPSRRSPPRPSTMSLDAYLADRGKG